MPSQTKLYSPDQVCVVFGAERLSGFADGTFVKVERNEDTFQTKVGADGEVTRTRNLNRTGIITVTLLQTSASNAALAALAAADELSPNGVSVLPVLVKDLNGNSLHHAAEAWVKKPAAGEYGKEVTTREWVIEAAVLQTFEGGNSTPA